MALPGGLLWVDGIDLAMLDLDVSGSGNPWAGPRVTRPSVQPFGVYGAVPSPSGTGEPRRIPLRLTLFDHVVADRWDGLDALHALLGPGKHEFRFGDAPDRVAYGVVEHIGGEGLWGDDVVWKLGHLGLPIELICHDPLRYDRYDRTLALSGTAVKVDLGGSYGAKDPVIEIFGASTAVTDPTIHFLRGQTRGSYATLALEGDGGISLGADDAVEVQLGRHRIIEVASGVRTRNLDLLALGAGGFPSLQGGPEGYCWIRLTSTAGTPTGRIRYRRAYP